MQRELGFKPLVACALALLTAGTSVANALQTATTTFLVSASILSNCSVTATPLAFGPYDPTAAGNVDATSTISVFCTVGTGYTLKLNIGTGGGTFATRTLNTGSSTLNFNLYTTTGRTTVWGDSSASTGTVTGTGTGLLSATTHTVYGRLPPAQDAAPGVYVSTVTVTLEYT